MPVKKPAPPPQVMDITHPKNVRPSTNSRPVLVTNRPMIAEDPMIAQAAREVVDKNYDQPAGAPSAPLIPAGEPVVNRQAKTITPINASHADEVSANAAEPVSEPAGTTDGVAPVQLEEIDQKAATEDLVQEAEKLDSADFDASEKAPEPKVAKQAPELQIVETPSEPPASDLVIDGEDTETDGNTHPDTPEEKQSHDLEALVAKGTYFVPINQVGKRRSRIMLTVIVFVLLALIALDILLDMGIINIPGLPHTTYFAF